MVFREAGDAQLQRGPSVGLRGIFCVANLRDIRAVEQVRRGVVLCDQAELQRRDVRLRSAFQNAGRLKLAEAFLRVAPFSEPPLDLAAEQREIAVLRVIRARLSERCDVVLASIFQEPAARGFAILDLPRGAQVAERDMAVGGP